MPKKPYEAPRMDKAEIVHGEDLGVGGLDGPKYRVRLVFSGNGRLSLRKNAEETSLISKRHTFMSKSSVIAISRTYRRLKEHGFNVPDQVSFYQDETGVYREIMSDMTDGGKKLIWGYSNRMTDKQIRELFDMNLSEDDFLAISRSIDLMIEMANKLGIVLLSHYYHILKEKKSGEITVGLLDIANYMFPDDKISRGAEPLPLDKVKEHNELQKAWFFSDLATYVNRGHHKFGGS